MVKGTLINCSDTVNEYVNREDWRIKANANTGYSHASLINNLAGKIIANWWLDEVYSKEEGDAHRNGDYHIHDLDSAASYCFTSDTKIKTIEFGNISIKDLLDKNIANFTVVSYDGEKKVECKAHDLRCTRKSAKLVETEFEDGLVVRCTPDHKFLLTDGTWKEIKNITNEDKIVKFDGSLYVKRVTNLEYKEDVYCMTVDDTHCFALENGVIAHNCCGHDLQKLLQEGFNGVVSRVGAKPPKHFREALYQMANYLGILQAEWAGAQAFASFDTLLAPYVFYDMTVEGLSERDIKKAIINFVYNLNVPSRWGQSPFTNLTIDWTLPPSLKDLVPMRGDKPYFVDVYESSVKEMYERDIKNRGMFGPGDSRAIEFIDKIRERLNDYESDEEMLMYSITYALFQPEMDIINRCFYQVLNEGDKDGQPFTFPIPTVNITEDFDWDNPNCYYLFENAAKYGSSYFQNFIGSQYLRDESGKLAIKDPNAYSPNDLRSMCCRLSLDKKALRKRGGGLFGSDSQTGSVGVVTINMARLGYLYKGNIEGLKMRLKQLCDMASSTLEKKRKKVIQMNEEGLYPYTRRYINTLDTFFSTIGVNGMNEMVRNFTNDEYDITDPRGQEMCKDLLDFINEQLLRYQEETGTLYNLEASPSEGTTYRFAREDKYRYGEKTKTFIECDKHGRIEVECSDDTEYIECPLCREESNS